MLLLVDAGNTRVKWALVPENTDDDRTPGKWADSGSVEHAEIRQLPEIWRDRHISRVLASNVAGETMRASLEQALAGALGMRPVPLEWFASSAERAGVQNGYRDPTQLGCDRFASVIGAHALFPARPLIVATCGTATTVDAVTAAGVFCGGMILPGLQLMASSLANNTAQLPRVVAEQGLRKPFADHTDAAIASGCIAAQAGAIERAVAAHERQSGERHGQVQCILSGGGAGVVAPHLLIPNTAVDNLVLIGLHTVAMQ